MNNIMLLLLILERPQRAVSPFTCKCHGTL